MAGPNTFGDPILSYNCSGALHGVHFIGAKHNGSKNDAWDLRKGRAVRLYRIDTYEHAEATVFAIVDTAMLSPDRAMVSEITSDAGVVCSITGDLV